MTGTAGAGKTVLGMHFLVAGARHHGQPGVIVSFDERPDSLVRNVARFGWSVGELIDRGELAVVDVSPDPYDNHEEIGAWDLDALIARVQNAVRTTGAKRIVLDSVGSMLGRFESPGRIRSELVRLVLACNDLGATTVITAERVDDHGSLARFGVEEFVTDAVIVLRNPLEEERRRRTIEVLKYRGADHQKGEFLYTIERDSGFSVIPITAIELEKEASDERVSMGNPGVDRLFGGGVYRDSLVLVSGPTGTGKTLLGLSFVQAAIDSGERASYISFEESRNQLIRNARSWSQPLGDPERTGQLKIMSAYPERMGLEDLLLKITRHIDEFRPRRVVIDSLTALERVSSRRAFREFVVRLTTLFKTREIAGLVTNTSTMLSGGQTVTDAYVSTISDGVVLLRYVERGGHMRRGITVLKMRGSNHDRTIREYEITAEGLTVGDTLADVDGMVVRGMLAAPDAGS